MIKLFFLLPILMSGVWWWYLKERNYSLRQGLTGFIYIGAFNGVVIGFFIMMTYLTHR